MRNEQQSNQGKQKDGAEVTGPMTPQQLADLMRGMKEEMEDEWREQNQQDRIKAINDYQR